MASPQLENGHLRIANELLDRWLLLRLEGSDLSILLFIARKTYGWQKKKDRISISQIIHGTNLTKLCIIKSTKRLKDKNLIIQEKCVGSISILGINKDHEKWVTGIFNHTGSLNHTGMSEDTKTGMVGVHKPVCSSIPTKDTRQKTLKRQYERKAQNAPLLPREIAIEFFQNKNKQEEMSQWLVTKGVEINAARKEIAKFIDYWTEPNHSGKKQRWEMEKAFELRRRFVTWLQRASKNYQTKPGQQWHIINP